MVLDVLFGLALADFFLHLANGFIECSALLLFQVTTITLKQLMKRGYESMLDYYAQVSLQFSEPLYTRPVRTVV